MSKFPDILVACATPKKSYYDTDLYVSLQNVSGVGFWCAENNKNSLASVYNDFIDKFKSYDFLVLAHDDVFINCKDLVERITKYGEMYDVFGLAGNTQVTINDPVLWHLMTDRKNLVGNVAHGSVDHYAYTSFGPIPSRALMVDGVFICINLKKLPQGVKFDENCPSKFHFYDLIFSMECALNKVKVGVGDIPIIHKSPGLSNVSRDWLDGQKYFLQKYDQFVGKTLTI